MKGWQLALHDLTDEQGKIGLEECLKQHSSPFMPSPGEYRLYCPGTRTESPDEKAREAWSLFWETIRSTGTDMSIIWKDAALAATIRKLGGWESFGEVLEADINFYKKDVISYYINSLSDKTETNKLTVGKLDRINNGNSFSSTYVKHIGYSKDDLQLIGTNEEKAIIDYQKKQSQLALPEPNYVPTVKESKEMWKNLQDAVSERKENVAKSIRNALQSE